MIYTQIFAISQQGLDVEKLRLDVVANNIANQHSIQNSTGALFHPQQVISRAENFENYLENPKARQGGIAEIRIENENVLPHQEYQPGHPAANREGYVTYPGVNTVDEMTTLIRASRAYEANLKMLNVAHSLALQALTIGEEK